MQNVKQECKKCKKEFILDSDDFSFYEKMKVPVPKICPDCRFKMRAMFRNEMTLYSGRKCGLCGKSVISMYNPKSPYTIYCYDCFYSDKWDPKDYAMDYDFSHSFLEQMKDFLIQVPKITLYLTSDSGRNVNSEYVNMSGGCKNCYLVFNTGPVEDFLYSRGIRYGRDSSDLYFGVSVERVYESINIQQSAGVIFGQNIVSCVDSTFILNGSGLTDCFGCVNLRNKSHYFFNEMLPRDEYKKKVAEIVGSYKKMGEMRKKFEELKGQDLYGLMIPPELAPFAYNESIAQDNFPLTREETISQGFRWQDNLQKTEGKETLRPENIPDHIQDVKDSITEEILRCINCNRNYKITNQELLFYKKMTLPIPRKCFYCRHQDRVIRRGPYKFWNRNCAKCKKEITTNYAPDRPEIVYCEKCYQAEVY